MSQQFQSWLKSTIQEVGTVFVGTFLSTLAASGLDLFGPRVTSLSILQKAALAGVAAAVTVIKAIIAKKIGSPSSASLLRSDPGPAPFTQPKSGGLVH